MKQEQEKMFNFLQSALIVLLVIHRLNGLPLQHEDNYFSNSLAEKHYRALFQGLCTIPDWTSNAESWPEFTLIEEIFFKSYIVKADIVYILTDMYARALRFKQSMPEVLFSIPILHFAQGVWEPFKDATEVLVYGTEIKGPFSYFKEITTKW